MEDKDCINTHCEFYDENAHQNCGGDCGGEPAIASCKNSQSTEPPETVESLRSSLSAAEKERDTALRERDEARTQLASADGEIESLKRELNGCGCGVCNWCNGQTYYHLKRKLDNDREIFIALGFPDPPGPTLADARNLVSRSKEAFTKGAEMAIEQICKDRPKHTRERQRLINAIRAATIHPKEG